jgi:DNA polymerase III subunit delta
MAEAAPVVYILHGEDDFAIAGFLTEMEKKMGDASTAEMNTTRLDGGSVSADQILTTASAMPFLAKRRLVLVTKPLARVSGQAGIKKFLEMLEKIPPTTALVLILEELPRSKDKKKPHWLEEWASSQPGRAYLKAFPLPKGHELVKRIQEMARKAGGQIDADAAETLGQLVGGEPRLAEQEINKLLAYVNYQRPIDEQDVQAITADVSQGDIFQLVDALGNRNGKQAMGMLHRLLEYQDYFEINGMVVRQFRLLLQAKEILERGGQAREIAGELRQHPFVAEKIAQQTRHFSRSDLDAIYHRLLDIDLAVKTSQMTGELAMEALIISLTSGPEGARSAR